MRRIGDDVLFQIARPDQLQRAFDNDRMPVVLAPLDVAENTGAPNLIAMEAAAVGVQAGLPMKSTNALSTSVSWSMRMPRMRFSLNTRISSRDAPGLPRRMVFTPIRCAQPDDHVIDLLRFDRRGNTLSWEVLRNDMPPTVPSCRYGR